MLKACYSSFNLFAILQAKSLDKKFSLKPSISALQFFQANNLNVLTWWHPGVIFFIFRCIISIRRVAGRIPGLCSRCIKGREWGRRKRIQGKKQWGGGEGKEGRVRLLYRPPIPTFLWSLAVAKFWLVNRTIGQVCEVAKTNKMATGVDVLARALADLNVVTQGEFKLKP